MKMTIKKGQELHERLIRAERLIPETSVMVRRQVSLTMPEEVWEAYDEAKEELSERFANFSLFESHILESLLGKK